MGVEPLLIAAMLALDRAEPPMVRAALSEDRGHLAAVGKSFRGPEFTHGGGVFWVIRWEIASANRLPALMNRDQLFGRNNPLLRWQILDDSLSCVAYHWADDDRVVRRGDGMSGSMRDTRPGDERDLFGHRRPQVGEHLQIRLEAGPSFAPVRRAVDGKRPGDQRQVYFDFWCRGDRRFEVFVTEPSQRNRLLREDFRPQHQKFPDTKESDSQTIARLKLLWERKGEWTFDWTGPFFVAAVGDERFFVTETGRVYATPKGAEYGAALKVIWSGPRVEALIHDSDAATWYAFTKDQWFEIADPIMPKPHKAAVKRAWKADEALVVAKECGRVIRQSSAPPPVTARTWDNLASADVRIAQRAVWSLSREPQNAFKLAKSRLAPTAAPTGEEVTALFADLGADSFARREAAHKRLRAMGTTIEPHLRDATAAERDPERASRLRHLLDDARNPDRRTGDESRAKRVVVVLDRIGTQEAKALLKEYTTGAEHAVLTREARKTLR